MRLLMLFTAILGGSLSLDSSFLQFVKEHNKHYSTADELEYRQAIFEKNYQDMSEHNAKFDKGEVTWHRKVTPYYDLTYAEFASLRLNSPKHDNKTTPKDHTPQAYLDKLSQVKNVPSYWNWVEQGGVTSIKNQGHCGSCSAFATTAVVETCFWQASGVLYDDLSEQFLMDCAYGHEYHDSEQGWFGAWGCDGAWDMAYIDYIINESGGKHQKESHYPYQGEDHHCRSDDDGYYSQAIVTDKSIVFFPSALDMQKAVHISPVSTDVDATYLGDYDYGIFDESRCCESTQDSDCYKNNNHAVTVVGYGEENGQEYWLVKNSWGERFGEDGYFKLARGTGLCGFGGYYMSTAICEAV